MSHHATRQSAQILEHPLSLLGIVDQSDSPLWVSYFHNVYLASTADHLQRNDFGIAGSLYRPEHHASLDVRSYSSKFSLAF